MVSNTEPIYPEEAMKYFFTRCRLCRKLKSRLKVICDKSRIGIASSSQNPKTALYRNCYTPYGMVRVFNMPKGEHVVTSLTHWMSIPIKHLQGILELDLYPVEPKSPLDLLGEQAR